MSHQVIRRQHINVCKGKKKEINRRQGKENYIGYLENTSQPEPSKNFEQNEIRNSDKIV